MYRQLTKEDRLRIYEGLNRNESLSEIGRAIGIEMLSSGQRGDMPS